MDFKLLEGLTVDSVVTFNIFFAVAQSLIALPFLRRYHQRTNSPFGFHPFRRLGTVEERHNVYRFAAFLLIFTGLPQIPINITCLYLPRSFQLAIILFLYPFILFALVLLLSFLYTLRVAARGRRTRRQAESAQLDAGSNA